MAFVRDEFCLVCDKHTPHINNDGCSACNGKKKAEEERMWEAQDTDTKLTNLRKRIEWLENHQHPMRY